MRHTQMRTCLHGCDNGTTCMLAHNTTCRHARTSATAPWRMGSSCLPYRADTSIRPTRRTVGMAAHMRGDTYNTTESSASSKLLALSTFTATAHRHTLYPTPPTNPPTMNTPVFNKISTTNWHWPSEQISSANSVECSILVGGSCFMVNITINTEVPFKQLQKVKEEALLETPLPAPTTAPSLKHTRTHARTSDGCTFEFLDADQIRRLCCQR